MLAVVCWKWGTLYTAEHVNRLKWMVARHLRVPHTFWCITDDPTGLDSAVQVFPLWPSCELPKVSEQAAKFAGLARIRRLQLFDPTIARQFGPQLFQLDVDVVITGDITPLVRRPDPVLVLGKSNQWQIINQPDKQPGNPSLLLFDADALGELWEMYRHDPTDIYAKAYATRRRAADGAVLGWYLNHVRTAPWGFWDLQKYGIYEYNADLRSERLPPYYRVGETHLPVDARVVMFMGGRTDMADPAVQARSPWIKEHWR